MSWRVKALYAIKLLCLHYKWVPVTTAWRALGLWMEERPPIWRLAANILQISSADSTQVWSSSFGVGRNANKSSQQKRVLLRNWLICLGPGLILWYLRHKQWKGIWFGTWNIRNLCRLGWLTAVARELARYKLDSVGVQELKWDSVGTIRAGDYNFFYGKRNKNYQLGTKYIVHHRRVSVVNAVQTVNDRMSNISSEKSLV